MPRRGRGSKLHRLDITPRQKRQPEHGKIELRAFIEQCFRLGKSFETTASEIRRFTGHLLMKDKSGNIRVITGGRNIRKESLGIKAPVAQVVERRPEEAGVGSASLPGSTKSKHAMTAIMYGMDPEKADKEYPMVEVKSTRMTIGEGFYESKSTKVARRIKNQRRGRSREEERTEVPGPEFEGIYLRPQGICETSGLERYDEEGNSRGKEAAEERTDSVGEGAINWGGDLDGPF